MIDGPTVRRLCGGGKSNNPGLKRPTRQASSQLRAPFSRHIQARLDQIARDHPQT